MFTGIHTHRVLRHGSPQAISFHTHFIDAEIGVTKPSRLTKRKIQEESEDSDGDTEHAQGLIKFCLFRLRDG